MGHHTQDEGERGHQDRSQAGSCRLDHGVAPALALLFGLLGELDDQDGVLGGEADEHDQANLDQDVVVQTVELHAGDGRQEAHWHDQHDRERQGPALVQRASTR
jgi:hypothetical protein